MTAADIEIQAQAMINAAIQQRNAFADQLVNLSGQLALKDAEIARLKEQALVAKAKKAK